MGRVRKFIKAVNPSLVPKYTKYNGVASQVSKGNIACVCGQCGEVFRAVTVAGVCCPKCGAGNFYECYPTAHIPVEQNRVEITPTGKTLHFEDILVSASADSTEMIFSVHKNSSIEYDGFEFVSSGRYVWSITKEQAVELTDNAEEIQQIFEWRRTINRYCDDRFELEKLNCMIKYYRGNHELKKLMNLYPEEISTLFGKGVDLTGIRSIDDICTALGIPTALKPYRKYIDSSESINNMRVILESPNGATLGRYVEREAFSKHVVTDIAKTIRFVDSIVRGKPIDSRIDWQFRMMRNEIGEHTPRSWEKGVVATGAMETSTLELFYDFQAKNCLIYGACWGEFIFRCRWLMQNNILITDETLDTKNFYTTKNKTLIGKAKFYELVVDDPLKAIDYI